MKIVTCIVILMALCSIAYAESLRVTLDTPSVTFRDAKVGDISNGFLKVTNQNNFSVMVKFSQPTDINLTYYGATDISVEPGDNYTIIYYVNIIKNGTYVSTIPITFSTDMANVSPKSFTLGAIIKFVNVNNSQETPPETPNQGNQGGGGGGGGGSSGGGVPQQLISIPKNKTIESPIETPIASPSPQEEQTPNETEEQQPLPEATPEPQQEARKPTSYWIYGIIMGLIIIALIVYLVARKKGKKEEPINEDEENSLLQQQNI